MKFVENLENVFEKYEKYLGKVFNKNPVGSLKNKNPVGSLKPKKVFSNKLKNETASFRLKLEKDSANIENTADWKEPDNATRVFEKFDLNQNVSLKPDMIKATITVVDGLDESSRTQVFDSRVNIGRRPSNELF